MGREGTPEVNGPQRREGGWGGDGLPLLSESRVTTTSWASAAPSSPGKATPTFSNQCQEGRGSTFTIPSFLAALAPLPSFKPATEDTLI